MNLGKAEEHLEWAKNDLATDRSVVEALAWAIAELKNAQEEIKEDAGIMNIWRRRTTQAENKAENLEEILDVERKLKKKLKWLPEYQYQLAKCQRDKASRILGGIQDFKKNELILVRGDFHVFRASFSSFKPSGDGTTPDFKKLDFIDGGFTVVLGEYQAASDAILEEVKDVHTEHCCKHGCKYSEYDCTVVLGIAKQSFPCEACEEKK